MKWYKVKISKPCSEDWNKMIPKNNGRFCEVCDKTVVDFTGKSPKEIQEHLKTNTKKRVCGRFKNIQLDSVNIEIPLRAFQNNHSVFRIFALALLFTMGTTLMSCQKEVVTKKIETVSVVDSIVSKDTLNSKKQPQQTLGVIKTDYITETLGEIILEEPDDYILGFVEVETPPKFKNQKAKENFADKINAFVKKNFNIDTTINLGLSSGKKRINVQFIIDENGIVKDVKVRAPHKLLEKEAKRVIYKLPKFIPAKEKGENVCVKYNLPIHFIVEE